MIHKSGNYSFKTKFDHIKDGDVIEGGNYSQHTPDTEILKGIKDLTIRGGNFINVQKQPTWRIEGGNWAQIERCSHLHPELIEKGLKECAKDCKHRQGTEKQWVGVDEGEYRTEKNNISPGKPDVRVVKSDDSDGVTVQKFEKLVYVYCDKVRGVK